MHWDKEITTVLDNFKVQVTRLYGRPFEKDLGVEFPDFTSLLELRTWGRNDRARIAHFLETRDYDDLTTDELSLILRYLEDFHMTLFRALLIGEIADDQSAKRLKRILCEHVLSLSPVLLKRSSLFPNVFEQTSYYFEQTSSNQDALDHLNYKFGNDIFKTAEQDGISPLLARYVYARLRQRCSEFKIGSPITFGHVSAVLPEASGFQFWCHTEPERYFYVYSLSLLCMTQFPSTFNEFISDLDAGPSNVSESAWLLQILHRFWDGDVSKTFRDAQMIKRHLDFIASFFKADNLHGYEALVLRIYEVPRDKQMFLYDYVQGLSSDRQEVIAKNAWFSKMSEFFE